MAKEYFKELPTLCVIRTMQITTTDTTTDLLKWSKSNTDKNVEEKKKKLILMAGQKARV